MYVWMFEIIYGSDGYSFFIAYIYNPLIIEIKKMGVNNNYQSTIGIYCITI